MPTYIFGEGPTATVSGTHKDTYLDALFSPDGAFGGEVDLNVNSTDAFTLMRFDISSIPAGEAISTAVLRLYLASAPAVDPVTVAFHRMTTAWGVSRTAEGASEDPASASQATYNKSLGAPTSTGWAGANFAVGDYDAVVETTQVVATADPAGTAYDITLTSVVNEWHTGTANYGLALITASADACTFDSQESATAAERPLLTVVTTAAPSGSAAIIIPSRASLKSSLSL